MGVKSNKKKFELGTALAIITLLFAYGAGIVNWVQEIPLKIAEENYTSGNFIIANEIYTKHSKNPVAQNNLGFAYYNGTGVDEDKDKSFSYFVESAKQGNQVAFNNMLLLIVEKDNLSYEDLKLLYDVSVVCNYKIMEEIMAIAFEKGYIKNYISLNDYVAISSNERVQFITNNCTIDVHVATRYQVVEESSDSGAVLSKLEIIKLYGPIFVSKHLSEVINSVLEVNTGTEILFQRLD